MKAVAHRLFNNRQWRDLLENIVWSIEQDRLPALLADLDKDAAKDINQPRVGHYRHLEQSHNGSAGAPTQPA